ncbi:hypothetical protein BSKO_01442 [Bryopsis sp. KO-2023]|nr:hypothetical protein BSKO_01442 [Bryopsis sp. KO-2023]
MEGPKGSGRLISDKLPPRPSGKLQQGVRSDDPSSASTSYETGSRGGREGTPSTSGAQNAKAALEQLKSLVDDAVFLDEDTFGGMKTLAHYSQKLQASGDNAQKRIKALGQQLLASQAQLARKDEQIREEREKTKRVERKVEEIQQELDNNQVVFKMHYNEILQRNEEIERLKSVIEGLSSAGLS